MKVGDFITFELDAWINSIHAKNVIMSRIQRIIIDPLGVRENKFLISYLNEFYGIPASEVLSHNPGPGTQLSLF